MCGTGWLQAVRPLQKAQTPRKIEAPSHRIHERLASLIAALEREGEERTAALGAVPRSQRCGGIRIRVGAIKRNARFATGLEFYHDPDVDEEFLFWAPVNEERILARKAQFRRNS